MDFWTKEEWKMVGFKPVTIQPKALPSQPRCCRRVYLQLRVPEWRLGPKGRRWASCRCLCGLWCERHRSRSRPKGWAEFGRGWSGRPSQRLELKQRVRWRFSESHFHERHAQQQHSNNMNLGKNLIMTTQVYFSPSQIGINQLVGAALILDIAFCSKASKTKS